MQAQKCSILTLAPYKILPPKTGGQLAIIYLHDYLGKLCPDHIISTENNEDTGKYAFQMHGLFTNSAKRYLPFHQYQDIYSIARAFDINYIICEHPYMAPKAIKLSKKLSVPWFLRSHNIESERFRTLGKSWWKLLHHYERYAMQKAKGIFFITPEDAAWAQQNFEIDPAKCYFVPFGTQFQHRPAAQPGLKAQLAAEWNIDANKPWLYFLGALDYPPNEHAINFILDAIIPQLNNMSQRYEILIAGKGLSEKIQQRIEKTEHVKHLGFLPDIDQFIRACDIMLNPVITGGGIKTKAVEALGYNKKVVTAHSGAAGLLPRACGGNLYTSPDYDWNAFTDNIIAAMHSGSEIPDAFYEHYYCGNIAQKVVSILKRY